MSTPTTAGELYAHSTRLNKTLQIAFDCYNSQDLQFTILIAGHRSNGTPMVETLKLSSSDPEIVNFFEQYASNLYAKKLTIDQKLSEINIPSTPIAGDIGKLKVESEGGR